MALFYSLKHSPHNVFYPRRFRGEYHLSNALVHLFMLQRHLSHQLPRQKYSNPAYLQLERLVGKIVELGSLMLVRTSMYQLELGKLFPTQKFSNPYFKSSKTFKIFPTALSNYMHVSNSYFRFSPSFQRRFGTTMSVTTRSHSSSTDLITCSKKKVIIITVAVVILLAVTVTLLVVFLK